MKNLDKLAAVQAKVDEVTTATAAAVTSMVGLTEKTTELETKTADLAKTANEFDHGAKQLKNRMLWRNVKVRWAHFVWDSLLDRV